MRSARADRGQPVRDDEGRPPDEQPAQRVLDLLLRADVDRGGGLVEDEDARVGEQRTRERDQLALAQREAHAALAELGLVAVLQLARERVGADGLRGCDHVLGRRIGPRERDVLAQRAGEQEALLGHDPELRAQRRLRHLADVVPSIVIRPSRGS